MISLRGFLSLDFYFNANCKNLMPTSKLFAFSGQCLPLVVFFCLHIVDLKYSPILLWHLTQKKQWKIKSGNNTGTVPHTNSSRSGLSQLPQVPRHLWSPIKATACGGHIFWFIQLQYCIHTKYQKATKYLPLSRRHHHVTEQTRP